MKLHLDLGSGIAGDMFLAACLEIGLDLEALKKALGSLGLPGWSLEPVKTSRGGIAGTHLKVNVPHEHAHRKLKDIREMIKGSALADPVKERATAIFQVLAEAEGVVHGMSAEEVHFHEVGAADSILDICGAAFAVWSLGITEVTATPATTGSGFVKCDHGRMPVPVPAVVELFRRHKVPLNPEPVEGELITPTGASILVNLVSQYGACPLDRIDLVGYGLGGRNVPGRANALRIFARKETGTAQGVVAGDGVRREWVGVLSTHLDDMNPEWFGLVWERLFDAGALDVALIPITMKKGRPAVRLEVIVPSGREEEFGRMILRETTAIGVRMERVERLALSRRPRFVDTPWGSLQAKESGGKWKVEYEDLSALAKRQGWSMHEVTKRVRPHLAKAEGENK